jgi:phage-related holin
MTRDKKIQFNVNESEYQILKEYSEKMGISMAEVLRDYIKSLKAARSVRGLKPKILGQA